MRRRRTGYGRKNPRRLTAMMTTVLCLAVMTGFFGVKYVVSPWMNGGEAQDRETETAATVHDGDAEDKTENKTEDGTDTPTEVKPPETTETPETKQPETEGTVIEDGIDVKATTAYAVQMGSFSTEAAAKQRVQELADQGISASAQLRDGAWKVVSDGYSTKEEAKAAAVQWRTIVGDAFVVTIP